MIHSHAAGKVLFAELPDDQVEQILDTHGLAEVTDETITDEAELQAERDRIAEDGYAVDWNEQVIGIGFITAPVVANGEFLGSVSVASPQGRFQHEAYREKRIQDIIAAAEEIAINYQYDR
ncbi:IclR family transcriptional regulator C-terminal domain-containing protein [Halostagnicola sp. A-GB9-2]|uniref:IclR family transcriptional regulator C-terminal domain-containing protein n=1 Tax=Halostagnicola sp. A-GB9-2 TaxID=3048066 RepID=UPI0024BFFC58|nr:IclR family transcriptional regulator C-terminal domain-containing protein [Halostagnicola sp. A-GB9-2]MDJ1433790.1 IclR family transcriptional regulator C-terminal domain-containing protein [Halostagnicola sp. A-GB9-2]